jgi:hypothetical protein
MRVTKGRGDRFVIYRILLVFLVASAFWWAFRVRDAEREFRESQQALRQVTSWRQQARIESRDNQQAEIVCPDNGPRQSDATSQSASDQRIEPFQNGSKSHSASSEKPSERKPGNAATVTPDCEKLRRSGHVYPLPDYDHLLEHTKIFKGAVDTVQGVKCQEWTTTRVISGRFTPAAPFDNAQICIGVDDHLPRRIKYDKAEYIFYDWNTVTPTERQPAGRAPSP